MVWCRAASVCVATLFSIHETTAWTFIGPGRYHSRAHRRHVPAPKSALLTGFSSRSCAKNPRVVVMSIINPDAKGGDNREEFVRVSLPKPLGIQLEEVRGGFPGLRVSAVVEGGSVIENGQISMNMFLVELAGRDVTGDSFDSIMETLMAMPANVPIDLLFRDPSVPAAAPPPPPPPPPAEPCELRVYRTDGKTVFISAKTGDNLRKMLLEANVDVYDTVGKMTNCNGSGQCGTCVVKVDDAVGWGDRHPWEGAKLQGRPENHRLACQTVIENDATITIRPPR